MSDKREEMQAALKPFGWTCTDAFWERYNSDVMVYNLANAVLALSRAVSDTKEPRGETQ